MIEQQEYIEWKEFFHAASVDKFKIKTYKFYFEAMYRGRHWDKSLDEAFVEFNNVKRIHAPSRKISKMGRCNLKNQPRLYLTSSLKSVPIEINLEKGNLFCAARFEAITQREIGPYAVAGQVYLIKNPILSDILCNYVNNFSEDNIRYDSQIGRIMTKKRINEGYNIYAITNAICSMYFHKTKKGSSAGWSKSSRSIGLIYPCVHFCHETFNLVMSQQEANKIFRVSKLDIYEYLDYTDGMIVRHLANGKVDSDNGNVTWMKDLFTPIQKFI